MRLVAILLLGCSSTPAPCTQDDARYLAIMAECELRIPAECHGLQPEECPVVAECHRRIHDRCGQ